MKLHSDTLTESDVREALQNAKDRGGVDRLVVFSELNARGSRKRKGGFEVRLEWCGFKVKGDGRRFVNSGSRGAGQDYAAFYSEWGWFIAELFAKDSEMIFDRYDGEENFHESTRHAFHFTTV
jgi:hypothetical protein